MARGPNTKTRILEAAERRFAEFGYDASALEDIARDVGIRAGAIYKHFANKLDLFDAVVTRLGTPLSEMLDKAGPDVKFERMGHLHFGFHLDHPRLARITLFASLAGGQQREVIVKRVYRPYFERTVQRLRKSSVQWGSDTDIAVQFIAFVSMFLGYVSLTDLFREILDIDPDDADVIAGEAALIDRFTASLMRPADPAEAVPRAIPLPAKPRPAEPVRSAHSR